MEVCHGIQLSLPEHRVVVSPPLCTMAPKELTTFPPPCSTVAVPSLLLLLTTKKQSRKKILKAEIPLGNSDQGWRTTAHKAQLELLPVRGKVSECECLWRACP